MEIARMEALREWFEVCEQDAITTPVVEKIQIRDTEWGYELKREHLVVTRYWVHDASPRTSRACRTERGITSVRWRCGRGR